MTTPTKLPRWDLREPQVRRFEPYIAKACLVARFEVNAKEVLNLKAHSFASRFRDAKRAFKTNLYASSMIPAGTNLDLIRVEELNDAVVEIRNLAKAEVESPTLSASNEVQVVEAIKALKKDAELLVAYTTEQQGEWLVNLERRFDIVVDPIRDGVMRVR